MEGADWWYKAEHTHKLGEKWGVGLYAQRGKGAGFRAERNLGHGVKVWAEILGGHDGFKNVGAPNLLLGLRKSF